MTMWYHQQNKEGGVKGLSYFGDEPTFAHLAHAPPDAHTPEVNRQAGHGSQLIWHLKKRKEEKFTAKYFFS